MKKKIKNIGNFVGFYRKISTTILKVEKKVLKLRRKHGTFRDFVGADIAVTAAAATAIATASLIWWKVPGLRHEAYPSIRAIVGGLRAKAIVSLKDFLIIFSEPIEESLFTFNKDLFLPLGLYFFFFSGFGSGGFKALNWPRLFKFSFFCFLHWRFDWKALGKMKSPRVTCKPWMRKSGEIGLGWRTPVLLVGFTSTL